MVVELTNKDHTEEIYGIRKTCCGRINIKKCKNGTSKHLHVSNQRKLKQKCYMEK